MRIHFTLQYATQLGENLFFCLKQADQTQILPMQFIDSQSWGIELESPFAPLNYYFCVQNTDGELLRQERVTHSFDPSTYGERSNLRIVNHWDQSNFLEHVLSNKIFAQKKHLMTHTHTEVTATTTHIFRIHVPLYHGDWAVCLLGAGNTLGHWQTENHIPLAQVKAGIWQVALDLSADQAPLSYKYGLFNHSSQSFISFELGENRTYPAAVEQTLTIVEDVGYRFLPEQRWHAAGVAIPVFSLRGQRSLGSGEFADLKSLGDWAHSVGLSIIQLLPINDSTVNYSWEDQYPYSAISVYALHPQYLSILDLPYALNAQQLALFKTTQARLNDTPRIEFAQMIQVKWQLIRSIFDEHFESIEKDTGLQKFIQTQTHWLKPYAAFCTLRDHFGTLDYAQWGEYSHYAPSTVQSFFEPKHEWYRIALLHCFVQYHLHLQLTEAVSHLHQLGVSLKGDLPIGVRRHSVDTWMEPELFSMDFQAGAPPDMFSDLGQNWELPTYNWPMMQANDYRWWKDRLSATAQYFDALRIDHVLGFFRIWRIPMHVTQGLLGYFYPALGYTADELIAHGIDFNVQRDCTPYITNELLETVFVKKATEIANQYFQPITPESEQYQLKSEFDTQRKLVEYFKKNPTVSQLQESLLSIHANVLFIAEETPTGTVYHPRFNLHQTYAYQVLPHAQQNRLYELHNHYFYVRQDNLWRTSGLEKLPALQHATDMLICAEDLGLVPDCVPQVLDELGIVALKIQRSPKEAIPFYDPAKIDYMNVATTSSHDSSTLRQWWTENPALTQLYYEQQLGKTGTAPAELTPDLAAEIIEQHFNSPAMLTIIPMQDLLATSADLRDTNVKNERINNPANADQRWDYRMSIMLNNLYNNQSLRFALIKLTHCAQ